MTPDDLAASRAVADLYGHHLLAAHTLALADALELALARIAELEAELARR